jgi:cytoskeletal protein CcmA (bactofilin family)
MAKDDFTAFLGSGTEYQGQLHFKGTVRIDCRFTGTITSDGKLILGKEAVFDGTVSVKELVVHGMLNGEALVASRTILHQNAKFIGILSSPALIMEEGALLQGELIMDKEASKGRKTVEHAALAHQAERSVAIVDAAVKQ